MYRLNELWPFLKERKKFWLLPFIVVMAALGAMMIFEQGSEVPPFIYTLF